MTTLRIEFEPDEEDGGTVHSVLIDTSKGGQFFAAWLNPFDEVEWTNTDEIHGSDTFADLQALMEAAE
jgi:hypothetical protein